jgi:integrase
MKARQVVRREARGGGSIFYRLDPHREGTDKERRLSSNLWLSYRVNGKEIVVSARTKNKSEAIEKLHEYTFNRTAAAKGLQPLITRKDENVTVGELLDANLRRAQDSGCATAVSIGYRTKVLKALLGGIRALDFRPEHADHYRERREQGAGTKHGTKVGPVTIRRELETLQSAFNYARKRGVIHTTPYIEKPREGDERAVEVPLDRMPQILAAVEDDDARDFIEWLLLTAMRPKGVGRLRWEWFDADGWTLSVPSEKGGNAREYAIDGSLRAVIERRLARRIVGLPVIFHLGGRAFDSDRGAARVLREEHFYRALAKLGLPYGKDSGFILYDIKRTAIGALSDAGLSEAEVQHFSGHKTSAMVRRYCVRGAERHRAAIAKRDAFVAERLANSQGGSRKQ